MELIFALFVFYQYSFVSCGSHNELCDCILDVWKIKLLVQSILKKSHSFFKITSLYLLNVKYCQHPERKLAK